MGLFRKRKPSKIIIQGELVEATSGKKELKSDDAIPEWSPVVAYSYGEITSYDIFYLNHVQNDKIDKFLKNTGSEKTFYKNSKSLSSIRLRDSEEKNNNAIVESLGYNTIVSNISNKDKTIVDFAIADETNIQIILICGTCLTIPLFPNEIIGFRSEDKSLKFICDQCSCDTGKKSYPIEKLAENNISYFKDLKIVKNMKEFKPTTLLTDYDNKPRPQFTQAKKIERDAIRIGEKNDLRTSSKNLKLKSLEAPLEDDKNKTGVSGELDSELNRTLEELNDLNKNSTIDEIFENKHDKKEALSDTK